MSTSRLGAVPDVSALLSAMPGTNLSNGSKVTDNAEQKEVDNCQTKDKRHRCCPRGTTQLEREQHMWTVIGTTKSSRGKRLVPAGS